MPIANSYILSTVCLPHTVPMLVLCQFVHSYLLYNVHCLSTSHCTVSWLCATMSTAVFCILYSLCLSQTVPSLFYCYYAHCYLLHTFHYLSTTHCTSVCSVSLFPLLSSILCQLSVYLTPYPLLFLFHYIQFCLLHSLHCLSVSPTVTSDCSLFLSELLFLSTAC